ncbi:VOC family protein [Adhaeribacter swui]|uniref:Bleomycin resistance protein n=1 Tax=Adhaeribacter swui TaxID=2086471 RepID=A0A7G7GC68_9BACT|nr:VOC family protein [Adhaeribacter swui]QNF34752.1 VOC family protein [Adhaeribacter swui]
MISKVIPKLPFIDKQQTLAFYVDQLGFQLQSDYGDYLIIDLHEVELHFFAYPNLEPAKSDFMIYLRVDTAIEKLYQQIQTAGVLIHPNGSLKRKLWHQKEFSVIDPNGTLLTFGQAAV